MSVDGIGAGGMQAFGAQVVTETLDTMNGGNAAAAPVDGQTAGASVVTQTINYMNQQDGFGGGNADYEFQKDVLGAAMSGKGGVTSTKA